MTDVLSQAVTESAPDRLHEARLAFRDELLASGLLVGTSVPGIYGRSGDFERVVAGLDALLGGAFASLGATVLRFPPVYPRADFERTDYIASFPDLSGVVSSFEDGDREHRELLAAREEGRPWDGWLKPADVVLTNAICHPLYATLEGTLAEGGGVYDLSGYGFRHEPSFDPMRLQSFRMREFVFVGTPDDAQLYRDTWLDVSVDLLASLGLAVQAVPANDPFFGRAGKMLVSAQLRENLKVEIIVPLYGDLHEGTAIASANCQRDHLTHAFDIKTADGQIAHGACVAFGIERTTLALVRTHGTDLDAWPTDVRALLGL